MNKKTMTWVWIAVGVVSVLVVLHNAGGALMPWLMKLHGHR